MNVSEMYDRLAHRLDQVRADPVYYTEPQMLAAINRIQRLFCLLTPCLERTAPLPLTAAQATYDISSSANFPDFLLPLRVTVNGSRVAPATLHQLDMLETGWRNSPGTPERYAYTGFYHFAVYRQPAAPGTSLDITYAAEPAELVDENSTPEIDEAYHPSLVHGAEYVLRWKEGGQEMASETTNLDRFLQDADRAADYVRSKARGQAYDIEPPDLRYADMSKVFKIKLPKQANPFARAA